MNDPDFVAGLQRLADTLGENLTVINVVPGNEDPRVIEPDLESQVDPDEKGS